MTKFGGFCGAPNLAGPGRNVVCVDTKPTVDERRAAPHWNKG